MLALLERHLPMERILDMPVDEAIGWLDAWRELTKPDEPKKYLVKREK